VKTVAVIGGGISGLSAAEAIGRIAQSRGVELRAVVLEAGARAGGKIGTRHHDGFSIETGPHGFLDKEPLLTQLIERLGLTGRVLRADEAAARRYIVQRGSLCELPMSPPKFLLSRVLPLFAKLRLMLEPLIARRPADAAEESVWSFAARRMGREAADVLIDAMVSGVFGGDPRRLSIASAFPAVVALERAHGSLIRGQIAQRRMSAGPRGVLNSFDQGLAVLIDALAARLEVKTSAAVERIERTGSRWRLALATGEAIEADVVVATAPADATARLIAPLDDDASRALDAIPYAPIAVVVQAFEACDLPRALDGFGFLAPDRERRKLLGSIFASTVFRGHAPDGTVMLRSMLGGARHPENAEGDDATLLARARGEIEALLGLAPGARPKLEEVLRWPRAIPQYELGHAERVRRVDHAEKRLPGLLFGGNALRGVAVVQCVADAERLGARALDLVTS